MRHLQKSGIITLKALGSPIGSRTAQVQEQQLEETKFIAFFMGKKIDIDGKDLYDAKQKAITQLKVPKSKVGLLAVVSAESQKNQDFRFESVNEEVVNEGKKAFKINPGIGSSKYSISSHDGVKKHKDGSDFYDIEIFKNKVDLEKGIKDYKSKGFVEESVNEENPGLWANIRAKQARGEAPAPKNSKAYKDAVAAGKEINKEQKSLKREALKSIVREVMQEEAEYQKFFQKVMDKAGKSIPSMGDEEKKAFFNKVDAAWSARGEKNESVNEGPFTNVLKMADKNFERHNTIKEKWLAIDKSKMANGIEKLDKKDQNTIENLFKEVTPTDMNTLIPVCKFILSTPAAFSNDILSACRNIVNQK